MTPLRFSMLTATLLTFAATVHAQAPPDPTCPCSGLTTWFTPYLHQSMQTWQQVRTLATGRTCDGGVCGSVAAGSPGCCKTGAVKCCEAVQTPASCCCAKGCACCESCKAKKDVGVKVQQSCTGSLMLGAGLNSDIGVIGNMAANERNFNIIAIQQAERDLKMAEFYLRTGHPGAARFYLELLMRRSGTMLPPIPIPAPYQSVQVQAMPLPPACCTGPVAMALPYGYPPAPPMARQIVQIQAVAAPPMHLPPPAIVHVADCVVPAVKHAHLVTPDLEAHCMRMTHRGDTIILEGDVILLNKKHAQPIRIEAQRAIINMKDGSVTVEGSGSVSSFGVMRTSAVAPVVERVQVEEHRFKTIQLRNAHAVDVAKLLNNGLPKSPDLRPKVEVFADPINNSVLISGSPHCIEVLAGIVADLDKYGAYGPVKLPSASPTPFGLGR